MTLTPTTVTQDHDKALRILPFYECPWLEEVMEGGQ